MPGPIQRLGQSDLRNTGTMQHLADVVNEGQYVSVTGDLEAMATPSGRAILHKQFTQIFDRRFAQIVGVGPATDARYMLKILGIMNSSTAGTAPPRPIDNLKFEVEPNQSLYPEGGQGYAGMPTTNVGPYVPAINLSEIGPANLKSSEGTQLLRVDGTVFVECFCAYDSENPQQPHWLFSRQPPLVIPVQLTIAGGADGTGTAAPSYVYDIKDLYTGATLNTSQTPKNKRTVGKALQGDFGYAHFDTGSSGKYVLGLCNEAPDAGSCPTG